MFDAIVVGSGPAGVMAARQLCPSKILMLDVGYTPTETRLPTQNIYDLKREGVNIFPSLIGEEFESLHNLDHSYKSPKLKGPLWSFVTRHPACLPSDRSETFEPVMSYARGGLANAWGAGALRFNEADLKDFPISARELQPFYDQLTAHIGINGEIDDLSDYFGSTEGLLPPIPLSPLSLDLMTRYNNKRPIMKNKGITIGRTRAAILTEDYQGRLKYQNFGQDFFQPDTSAIYHPGHTLKALLREGALEYLSNHLVTRFETTGVGVRVYATDLKSEQTTSFECKRLFLAAGALNSARIVLASNDDYSTKLPLLDNPVSFIPFINPCRIGDSLPVHAFSGGELIVLYDGPQYPVPLQASFYSLGAPLRTDLLTEFPLAFRGNLTAGKYLLPALAMLQVFYPDEACTSNYLRLQRVGSLEFNYAPKELGAMEALFIRALRKLHYYSAPFLCKYPIAGSSIHYAGPLGMKSQPTSVYDTNSNGELFGAKNVFVVDGACFPRLPSKNHTFTIMANAMRIAEIVKQTPAP